MELDILGISGIIAIFLTVFVLTRTYRKQSRVDSANFGLNLANALTKTYNERPEKSDNTKKYNHDLRIWKDRLFYEMETASMLTKKKS